MKKFSIIVPVYNTGKVLKRCIDSILNQTYDDFELIIVNDGSTDDSLSIIKEYRDKRIIVINQENKGLSGARNSGVDNASGEYLLFIDSDDYISSNLLKTLNERITTEDVVRFQIKQILLDSNTEYHEEEFSHLNGIDAFKILSRYKFVETVCCYSINREFYLKNKFKFRVKTYHEDFGLTPLIIIRANDVSSIDYIGYNYLFFSGSITNFTTYEKEVKKAKDVMIHYDNLIDKSDDKYYQSFLANSVLLKINKLKGKERKEYINDIKKRNIVDKLLDDTFKRKIKKYLLKINTGLFIRGLR